MIDNNEFTIPVFDGENYNLWKKRITMFLKINECESVIEREKSEQDESDWDEKELKAINFIYSAISNKQLKFVYDKLTAYEIIRKFDDLYLKSTALQIVCRNKLEQFKLKNNIESATFFSDFEKNLNELISACAVVSEKTKWNYILNTLPESYIEIGNLINTLKEVDQTVDCIKSKIQMVEIKSKKDDNSGTKSNAFTESKNRQEQTYYQHGKTGHMIKNCKHGGQTVCRGTSWRSTRDPQETGRGNYVRGRGYYHPKQQRVSVQRANQQEEIQEERTAWLTKVDYHMVQNRH